MIDLPTYHHHSDLSIFWAPPGWPSSSSSGKRSSNFIRVKFSNSWEHGETTICLAKPMMIPESLIIISLVCTGFFSGVCSSKVCCFTTLEPSFFVVFDGRHRFHSVLQVVTSFWTTWLLRFRGLKLSDPGHFEEAGTTVDGWNSANQLIWYI